jgi:carboxymethylenebutenolidase
MKDHMTVKGHDGTFTAYIARPEELPAPAVIVLQELLGVNADIREKCDELAEQGFIAIAPDLFWRQERARVRHAFSDFLDIFRHVFVN